MNTRIPAEVFPPGDFLREELEERGWTQTDFAEILGRDVTLVQNIIAGKRGISTETARGFAAALGTSPEFWLGLEHSYQLWRVKDNDREVISRRAKLYSVAPITDMVRRGWVEASENIDVLEKRVLAFYEVEGIDEIPNSFRVAARKSTSYREPFTPHQMAWLARARQLARVVHASSYSQGNVEKVLQRLKTLVHAPEETRHVARILSEYGIRLVVVQPLQGTKIDGAYFLLNGSPAIAISLRYDRIDNFWFTLLHELGHCGQEEASLDSDLGISSLNAERPLEEREADEFALKNLIAPNDIQNFIARKRPLYSSKSIQAFAHTKGVHPGIVVGQLQYRNEIRWDNFRAMLVPIREYVIASTLTDGWGNIVSI